MNTKFNSKKIKKILIKNIPSILFLIMGAGISFAWRISEGTKTDEKMLDFMDNIMIAFYNPFAFKPIDIMYGLIFAVALRIIIYIKSKNRKNFKTGKEYGNARWGKSEELSSVLTDDNFDNNIILTKTEMITMGKPSHPKYARNKNVLIRGASGSGKTRFYVKPNLMQMHSSYVITDPKGTVLIECGEMLRKGKKIKKGDKFYYEPYKIKILNTVDFKESMHYNPFKYISAENREKDILRTVEVLIKNTSGSKENNEDFWVKSERLLYSAYIALIFTLSPEEERNFATLIEMINLSEVREDNENFKNIIDIEFEAVERWINNNFFEDELTNEEISEIDMEAEEVELINEEISEEEKKVRLILSEMQQCILTDETRKIANFAVRQYRSFKLAAGKTAKSILISCSARLSLFSIDDILEITSYDELELDKIGDERTALFVIVPDTDSTFNFLVAMMYTQMFNLLCTKADKNPGGRLKYHVRCILDEFGNMGKIPDFEKLIATIRSREISATVILQTMSRLKSLYKDDADTIAGNCDSKLFLGGDEKTTVKELSEALGKETIDLYNTNESRGQSQSFGLNYNKTGRELMTQDEIMTMDNSKCILQVRGFHPFLSEKYDITKHPEYEKLLDFNPKRRFDTKKYLNGIGSSKAVINKTTQIDVYEIKNNN